MRANFISGREVGEKKNLLRISFEKISRIIEHSSKRLFLTFVENVDKVKWGRSLFSEIAASFQRSCKAVSPSRGLNHLERNIAGSFSRVEETLPEHTEQMCNSVVHISPMSDPCQNLTANQRQGQFI